MNVQLRLMDGSAERAAALNRHLAQIVASTASKIAAEAQRRLQQTGRPSAPGEAPDDPSGDLASSIVATAAGTNAEVTSTAAYAAYLELGTVKMAPRPFLLPAATEASAQVQSELEDL